MSTYDKLMILNSDRDTYDPMISDFIPNDINCFSLGKVGISDHLVIQPNINLTPTQGNYGCGHRLTGYV